MSAEQRSQEITLPVEVLGFDASLEELGVSPRACGLLSTKDIRTIGDLIAKTEGELNTILIFEQQSVDDIKAKLKPHGYCLKQG